MSSASSSTSAQAADIRAQAATPKSSPRLAAGVIFACCASVIIVAALLRPDPQGVGTHQALGLPPCGFLLTTRLPCPTCGYTTSFALVAHGQFWQALVNQPFAALLALATGVTMVISGYALIAGASLAPLGKRLWRPMVLCIVGALFLGAWIFKMITIAG
ncbi:MAG: DUF2752 domain-containing protein [Phycisphaeraceae bacterium]